MEDKKFDYLFRCDACKSSRIFESTHKMPAGIIILEDFRVRMFIEHHDRCGGNIIVAIRKQ